MFDKQQVAKLFNMMGYEDVSLADVKQYVDKAIKFYTDDLYSLETLEKHGAIQYSFTNGEVMSFLGTYFSPSENKYKFNTCTATFRVAINNSVIGTGTVKELYPTRCSNKRSIKEAISTYFVDWLESTINDLMENSRRNLLSE